VTGRWTSPGPSVSITNKTDHHGVAEILLKVALITINEQTKQTEDLAVMYLCVFASFYDF
jgi:hypothetical protein